jgi:crotonobetainyl-CoA:carnitine CoA-transferase CaiB-like acyl-CoA transferase
MTRPFEGIRIIDITHVAGRSVRRLSTGRARADVIKVEHPDEPDQSREGGTDHLRSTGATWGPRSLTQGSNKKSITLDLKTEAGREILKKLVARADVLVENYRPGAFATLGLGYEALSEINPRLIYCSISAFGQDGVRCEQTAYDHVIQATSGIMASTGTGRSTRSRSAHQRSITRPARWRLRARQRPFPTRAHRQGPAHRSRDARRRDDDAGLT